MEGKSVNKGLALALPSEGVFFLGDAGKPLEPKALTSGLCSCKISSENAFVYIVMAQ